MTTTQTTPSRDRPLADTDALLRRVLVRLEAIEGKVDQLSAEAASSPSLGAPGGPMPRWAAIVVDGADAWIRKRQAEGWDPDEAQKAAGRLLRQLTRPDVLEAVFQLVDKLPALANLTEAGPRLVATAVDAFDELSARAAEQGFDVDSAIKSFLTMGVRLTEVLDSPQFKALLASDVLAPETLEVVGRAGRALTEQSSEACARAGVLGLLTATRDADIQRALGFAIGFAQRFGQKMECGQVLPPAAESERDPHEG